MGFLKVAILPLSRFLISAVFLLDAIKNIVSFGYTEKVLIEHLSHWQAQFASFQELQIFFAFLISWSFPLLLFATVAMLMGSIFVLMGHKEQLGVSLLVIFLIPATILYHPFWWFDDSVYEVESAMFMKNLAIIGCLIKLLFRDSIVGTHPSVSFERY